MMTVSTTMMLVVMRNWGISDHSWSQMSDPCGMWHFLMSISTMTIVASVVSMAVWVTIPMSLIVMMTMAMISWSMMVMIGHSFYNRLKTKGASNCLLYWLLNTLVSWLVSIGLTVVLPCELADIHVLDSACSLLHVSQLWPLCERQVFAPLRHWIHCGDPQHIWQFWWTHLAPLESIHLSLHHHPCGIIWVLIGFLRRTM